MAVNFHGVQIFVDFMGLLFIEKLTNFIYILDYMP